MSPHDRAHHPGRDGRRNQDLQQRALEQLLRRKDVWRGQAAAGQFEVLKTGHRQLDKALQGGGWPMGTLIDVSQANNGHGEWQLFGPAIAQLSQQAGLIVLVNPPAMPYGPGLQQLGIDYRAIRVVRSNHRDALLAALVDVVKSRCCLAILAWEGRSKWRYAELRKLQLAATQSQCLSLCMRKQRPGRVQSPAPLRLHSQLAEDGLQVRLLKQRGQFKPLTVTLALPSLWAPDHYQLLHPEHSQQPGRPSAKVLPFANRHGPRPR